MPPLWAYIAHAYASSMQKCPVPLGVTQQKEENNVVVISGMDCFNTGDGLLF